MFSRIIATDREAEDLLLGTRLVRVCGLDAQKAERSCDFQLDEYYAGCDPLCGVLAPSTVSMINPSAASQVHSLVVELLQPS